jgi:hypothetical protein
MAKVEKLVERPTDIVKAVEDWASEKLVKVVDPRFWYKDESWKLASAKAKFKWVCGEPLTECQFDEAIKAVLEHKAE